MINHRAPKLINCRILWTFPHFWTKCANEIEIYTFCIIKLKAAKHKRNIKYDNAIL